MSSDDELDYASIPSGTTVRCGLSSFSAKEDIVAAIEAILFERDPIGINFETNTDE